MKNLLLVCLFLIANLALAEAEAITVNLRFNNQLPGLETATKAIVDSLSQDLTSIERTQNLGITLPDEVIDMGGVDNQINEPITFAPNETHELIIPFLGGYQVGVTFFDAENNIIPGFDGPDIDITESGMTIDLPFPEPLENQVEQELEGAAGAGAGS